MKLEPNGIGGERSARQPRPLDRPLAFLDPLLARPALVVEGHDALSRAAHVRHDEAEAGIKFSGMPFNLGDDPPRLGPASGLIAEARMGSAHMVRRTPDRAREQHFVAIMVADLIRRRAIKKGGWFRPTTSANYVRVAVVCGLAGYAGLVLWGLGQVRALRLDELLIDAPYALLAMATGGFYVYHLDNVQM